MADVPIGKRNVTIGITRAKRKQHFVSARKRLDADRPGAIGSICLDWATDGLGSILEYVAPRFIWQRRIEGAGCTRLPG